MSRSFGDLITEEQYNERKMKAMKKADPWMTKDTTVISMPKKKKKKEEKSIFRGLSSTNKTNRGPFDFGKN
jgi:hypothetical protein